MTGGAETTDRIKEHMSAQGVDEESFPHKLIGETEIAATGAPEDSVGYSVPYYDMGGGRVPYYRICVFDNATTKHFSSDTTAPHIYFPVGFKKLLRKAVKAGSKSSIVVCTSEIKAARLCAKGRLSCSIEHPYSWSVKSILLPKRTKFDTHIANNKNMLRAYLPTGFDIPTVFGNLARGLPDVIEAVIDSGIHIILDYGKEEDMDVETRKNLSDFAHKLLYYGIPYGRIHHVKRAYTYNRILKEGYCFPTNPSLSQDIATATQGISRNRTLLKKVAKDIIIDMDNRGLRMYNEERQAHMYKSYDTGTPIYSYMNEEEKTLATSREFALLIRDRYHVIEADIRLQRWIKAYYMLFAINKNSKEDVIAAKDTAELTSVVKTLMKFTQYHGENTAFSYNDILRWGIIESQDVSYLQNKDVLHRVIEENKMRIYKTIKVRIVSSENNEHTYIKGSR